MRGTRGVPMTFRGAMAAVCAALAVATGTAVGAPGDFDPSFDGDGKKTIDQGGEANAVALQADGKIVVVGSGPPSASADITVTRLNADGSLDASFGGSGTAAVDFGGLDIGRAVALQPDGKIVVAGDTSSLVDSNVAILRLHPDGALDRDFHGDGKRTIDQGGGDTASGVLVQPDGKIVVAGTGNGHIAVSRFLPNGSYDLTFDGGGTALVGLSGFDFGFAVALQADGRIVVTGTSVGGATVVARLDQNGVLDTTFDFDGVQTITHPSSSSGTAVALQADGKIVVAGPGGSDEDFAIARLNPNGGADASFAGSGAKLIDAGGEDYATGLSIQPNGKIVIVGSGNDGDMAVVRLQSDGSPDLAFGGTGSVFLDFGGFENCNGVALQPDGRLVVVGFSAGRDIIVARIEGDSPPVTPPGQPIPLQTVVVKPGKLVKLVAKGAFTLPDPAGDAPTAAGGGLTVSGATGTVTYALGAESWTALGPRRDGSKGYRFKGAGCTVLVKRRVVKAQCRGGTGTLVAPEPGPVDVVLAIGAGTTRYCGACGGIARGNTEKLFQRRACAAPATCP
jgi:uncharacterized delta-60 repeat protein